MVCRMGCGKYYQEEGSGSFPANEKVNGGDCLNDFAVKILLTRCLVFSSSATTNILGGEGGLL